MRLRYVLSISMKLEMSMFSSAEYQLTCIRNIGTSNDSESCCDTTDPLKDDILA